MADLIDKSLAITVVRQALVDAAYIHGSTMMKASSAMFKAEIYATNAIAALPVQGVKVKPLEWQLQAGKEGPFYTAFDPLYGRQVEAPDEQTCDAIDRNRASHVLAALEPAEAGGVDDWPSDGTCRHCGCAPVGADGLCNTCRDDPPAPTHVDALAQAAEDTLQQLDDLIANSEGVAGLHQNGDVADWESLLDGGSFGEWLYKLDELRATLAAYRGGAK